MKKIFYYSLLMVLVIVTGCRNEDELVNGAKNDNYQLKAQIESRVDSRTAVNGGNQVVWVENDKIGVYGDQGTTNVAFTLEGTSTGTTLATFTGDLKSGEIPATVYYPYDEAASLSDKRLTFTLPATYDYTENSNAPMIGVKQNDGSFLFKHLCGLLKFSITDIPSDATRLVITSTGESAPNIAGTCVVEDVTADEAILSISEGVSQLVIQMNGETGTQTFYVPIPVGHYAELQVTLEKEDGTAFFSEKLSDVSVRRATIVRVSDDLANIDQSVNEYIQASIDKDIVTFFSELDQLLVQNENISEYNLSISGCEITYKDESQQLIVFSYDNSESSDPSTPIEEEPTYSWIADIPEIDDFTLVSSTETCATTDDNIFQNTKIVRWAPFQTELGTGWNYSELLETSPLNLTVIGNYTNQEATFSSLMDNLSQAGIIDIETHGCQGKYIILPEKNMDGNVYKQIGSSIIVYFGSSDQVESVSEKNIGIPITTFERYSYVEDGILFNNSCESSQGSLGQAFIDKGISTYAGYTNIINTSGVQRFMNSYTSKLLCDLKSNNESIPDDLTYSGSSMDKKEDGTFEFIHIEGYFDVATSKDMRFVEFGPQGDVKTTETEIFLPFQFKGAKNLKEACHIGLLISNTSQIEEENIENYRIAKPVPITRLSDRTDYNFKTTIEQLTNALDETTIGSTGTKYYRIYLEYNGRYYISDDYGTFMLGNSCEDIMREYLVRLYHDTDGDNWTRNDNWLSDKPITEWYGVSYYSEEYCLYNVFLPNNNLNGSINMSGCTNLVDLYCIDNPITQVDVSDCINLESLSCGDLMTESLRSISVSNCINLNSLYCDFNQLTDLDVSDCIRLAALTCNYSNLASLDVSNCLDLQLLSCDNSKISSLNLLKNTELRHLNCMYCELTDLNISGCVNLETLNCNNNKLTTLSLPRGVNMDYIYCQYNNLENLNVAECASIKYLECATNRLVTLILPQCDDLEELVCNDNELTNLEVSRFKNLRRLVCSNNNLSSLNISGLNRLESLSCGDNDISDIDLSSCRYSLKEFGCYNTRITREIPDWFRELSYFQVDYRYYNYSYDYKLDKFVYTDRGIGWWYPGEPENERQKWDNDASPMFPPEENM